MGRSFGDFLASAEHTFFPISPGVDFLGVFSLTLAHKKVVNPARSHPLPRPPSFQPDISLRLHIHPDPRKREEGKRGTRGAFFNLFRRTSCSMPKNFCSSYISESLLAAQKTSPFAADRHGKGTGIRPLQARGITQKLTKEERKMIKK